MSRINKNKMWMGNPVLRQPSFFLISEQSENNIVLTVTGAEFVSYTKNGKTVLEETSEDINITSDQNTPIYIYGKNISLIESDGGISLSELNLLGFNSENADVLVFSNNIELSVYFPDGFSANTVNLQSDLINSITIPKDFSCNSLTVSDNNILSLDVSNINPETITSLNVRKNPFLSDETAALAFANSLPTVTTTPTLTMSSSDTQATAVQSIAEGKGWKVSIS